MYKAIVVFLIAGLLGACKKKSTSECGDRICTEEFRSVVVTFQNSKEEPVRVKVYTVVNLRSNEQLYSSSSVGSDLGKGVFVVANDSDLKRLSKEGDNIKVTATSEETNQTKSAIINVKGGVCECHVYRVSGPEVVKFD